MGRLEYNASRPPIEVEDEQVRVSRITVVVDVAQHPLEQITKQLNKLVNVLTCLVFLAAATWIAPAPGQESS